MAGSEECQISQPFYNLKNGKIAIEPPDLENSVKSTFSAIYDRVWRLFDIENNVKERKSRKTILTVDKKGKVVYYDVINFEK